MKYSIPAQLLRAWCLDHADFLYRIGVQSPRFWQWVHPEAERRGPGRVPDGQALAEFALVAPILFFAIIAMAEGALLFADKAGQDRATSVVAVWSAEHPGGDWQSVADAQLPGCDVERSESGDIVTIVAECVYVPQVTSNIWEGLPMSSKESAAMAPSPTPTPTPSPTPSPTP